ncbi:MAG TPA: hypothetical protein DCL77_09845, partial [Prolixibacteraceae bacterium]|nr:hypothetical protein [Prolixibacteraceae bacterium]
DPVYHQLVEKMNASLVLEFASPEVITFAHILNEKINYYQTTFAIRDNGSIVKKIEKEEV